jgi:membrane fusion protein (multidrug efflux system)
MKTAVILAALLAAVSISLTGCEMVAWPSEDGHSEESASAHPEHGAGHPAEHGHEKAESEHHAHKIVVTSPVRKDIVTTQPYVCQIHSCQHIELRALEGGYLQEIRVKEGQAVKKGELVFKILPVLFETELDAEIADANRIQIELQQAEGLLKKGIVAPPEIALKKAELASAQAKVMKKRAELSFMNVTAPFDGIVDRQMNQLGSLIEEGDILTTLSDNSTMWVYFNVPEKNYLEYTAELNAADGKPSHLRIRLKLANGDIFPQEGKIGAIEADFDNTTGTVLFRADFPNPDGLLRNGQTGTILIDTVMDGALVIPQRAKYETLAKQYVYVVDDKGVVHQRDIQVDAVQDDIFVIGKGLETTDKIVFEGIRDVNDGDKIEYEYKPPQEILGHLKFHAE